MSEKFLDDPSGDTQAFRAFAEAGEPVGSARPIKLIVAVAVAVAVVVVLFTWLALS